MGRRRLFFVAYGVSAFLAGVVAYSFGDLMGRHGDHDAMGHAMGTHVSGELSGEWSHNLAGVDLEDTDGTVRRFPDEFESGHYLVNFWATWCPPCVHELPVLSAFHGQSHPAVGVVGISLDEAGKTREFLENVPVAYDMLVAGPTAFDLMPRKGTQPPLLPITYLVDSAGTVVAEKLGPFADGDEIREFLAENGVLSI